MKRLVSFFEIPAQDFGRAVKFYESVFQISLTVLDCQTEKMAFFPREDDGFCPGAISFTEGFNPANGGVLVSLTVENILPAIDRIKKNGGTVIIPRTKIESDNRGYFAVFTDCEGNRLGLYEN